MNKHRPPQKQHTKPLTPPKPDTLPVSTDSAPVQETVSPVKPDEYAGISSFPVVMYHLKYGDYTVAGFGGGARKFQSKQELTQAGPGWFSSTREAIESMTGQM